MEPHIQYAKTNDGVNIAYWTVGQGEPLVCLPPLYFSHIVEEWRHDELGRWYQQLAGWRRVIRFDGRGMGLSDRDTEDGSVEGQVEDLRAVVDALDFQSFPLIAFGPRAAMASKPASNFRRRPWRVTLGSANAPSSARRAATIHASRWAKIVLQMFGQSPA